MVELSKKSQFFVITIIIVIVNLAAILPLLSVPSKMNLNELTNHFLDIEQSKDQVYFLKKNTVNFMQSNDWISQEYYYRTKLTLINLQTNIKENVIARVEIDFQDKIDTNSIQLFEKTDITPFVIKWTNITGKKGILVFPVKINASESKEFYIYYNIIGESSFENKIYSDAPNITLSENKISVNQAFYTAEIENGTLSSVYIKSDNTEIANPFFNIKTGSAELISAVNTAVLEIKKMPEFVYAKTRTRAESTNQNFTATSEYYFFTDFIVYEPTIGKGIADNKIEFQFYPKCISNSTLELPSGGMTIVDFCGADTNKNSLLTESISFYNSNTSYSLITKENWWNIDNTANFKAVVSNMTLSANDKTAKPSYNITINADGNFYNIHGFFYLIFHTGKENSSFSEIDESGTGFDTNFGFSYKLDSEESLLDLLSNNIKFAVHSFIGRNYDISIASSIESSSSRSFSNQENWFYSFFERKKINISNPSESNFTNKTISIYLEGISEKPYFKVLDENKTEVSSFRKNNSIYFILNLESNLSKIFYIDLSKSPLLKDYFEKQLFYENFEKSGTVDFKNSAVEWRVNTSTGSFGKIESILHNSTEMLDSSNSFIGQLDGFDNTAVKSISLIEKNSIFSSWQINSNNSAINATREYKFYRDSSILEINETWTNIGVSSIALPQIINYVNIYNSSLNNECSGIQNYENYIYGNSSINHNSSLNISSKAIFASRNNNSGQMLGIIFENNSILESITMDLCGESAVKNMTISFSKSLEPDETISFNWFVISSNGNFSILEDYYNQIISSKESSILETKEIKEKVFDKNTKTKIKSDGSYNNKQYEFKISLPGVKDFSSVFFTNNKNEVIPSKIFSKVKQGSSFNIDYGIKQTDSSLDAFLMNTENQKFEVGIKRESGSGNFNLVVYNPNNSVVLNKTYTSQNAVIWINETIAGVYKLKIINYSSNQYFSINSTLGKIIINENKFRLHDNYDLNEGKLIYLKLKESSNSTQNINITRDSAGFNSYFLIYDLDSNLIENKTITSGENKINLILNPEKIYGIKFMNFESSEISLDNNFEPYLSEKPENLFLPENPEVDVFIVSNFEQGTKEYNFYYKTDCCYSPVQFLDSDLTANEEEKFVNNSNYKIDLDDFELNAYSYSDIISSWDWTFDRFIEKSSLRTTAKLDKNSESIYLTFYKNSPKITFNLYRTGEKNKKINLPLSFSGNYFKLYNLPEKQVSNISLDYDNFSCMDKTYFSARSSSLTAGFVVPCKYLSQKETFYFDSTNISINLAGNTDTFFDFYIFSGTASEYIEKEISQGNVLRNDNSIIAYDITFDSPVLNLEGSFS